MFFNQEQLTARILDVVALDQKNSDSFNRRGYHALSFRLEADTRLSFRDRTLHAFADSIGYFPANLSYRRSAARDRMIVIHFELDNYYSGSIEMIRLENPGPVRALFERALLSWQEKPPGYYYRVTGCFYEILARIREEAGLQPEPEFPARIRPSIEYLNEQFTNPELTVAEIARQSFISEVSFRKIFRAATGSSPRRFLLEKRISYALSLLESRCLSIGEVAAQAGFSDPKYFSTVFRQTVGVPPSQYLYKWEDIS